MYLLEQKIYDIYENKIVTRIEEQQINRVHLLWIATSKNIYLRAYSTITQSTQLQINITPTQSPADIE